MPWEDVYPILKKYKEFEDVDLYRVKVKDIMKEFQEKYNLSAVDTVLAVKDILAEEYREMRAEEKK